MVHTKLCSLSGTDTVRKPQDGFGRVGWRDSCIFPLTYLAVAVQVVVNQLACLFFASAVQPRIDSVKQPVKELRANRCLIMQSIKSYDMVNFEIMVKAQPGDPPF